MIFDAPVISPEWLAAHADDLVLADVRWIPDGSSREAFARAHLLGAVPFDVDRDLAAPPGSGPGRHPLPSPEAFAAVMSDAGIGDDTPVVAYDDARGSHAARLWWMLDALEHPVALLDGGLQAWPGPTETGAARAREPGLFTARPWPADRFVADAAGIIDAARTGGITLMDARAGERYRGEVEPFDPVAGHIPGARNLPWSDALDPATGRFLDPEALSERFAEAGLRDAGEVIAQCGSGVTACMDLVAMRLAGLGHGRLYVGSWSDWVSDPDRPVATGPEPGTLS